MALTGFDPEKVSSSIGRVKTAYENLITALGDTMQNKFVGGMQDKWACKQAQTFFNEGFKPSIDSLINDSNKTFQSVIDAMNSAGRAWAESTNSQYSTTSFSVISKTMDVSGIQENIGGVRGIDLASANSVAGQLPQIAEQAKSALTSAQQAVQGCGFIGGGQEQALVNSLGTIKTNIDSNVTEITNQVKTSIEQTVTAYSDLEGRVSQAFNGQ